MAGPGGRASWGPRLPDTGGRAWAPAGSGFDLVPCRGLSVSLALLGKVWVLGLGRGAACGGRTCPGREALRQAAGSTEVAGVQATKGSPGGGGGRTNFLTGYRAGGERGGRPCMRPPHPPHAHSTRRTKKKPRPQGRTSGHRQVWGGSVCHKRKQMTHEKTNKTEQKNVQLARAAATWWPQQQAGTRRGPLPRAAEPPLLSVGAQAGGGQVTHPGAAERAGGQA